MAHLFITGASGAIGSALIPRLLAMPGQRVTMLLRSASDAAMAERVDRMARYWGLSSEALRDRVTAVRGASAAVQGIEAGIRVDIGVRSLQELHSQLAEK